MLVLGTHHPGNRWGLAVPTKNGTPQGAVCKAGGASCPCRCAGASALALGDGAAHPERQVLTLHCSHCAFCQYWLRYSKWRQSSRNQSGTPWTPECIKHSG